jgi:signal transduction histidine kinase/sugar lactone lactonase YvrE
MTNRGYFNPSVAPGSDEMFIATPDNILGYRNGEFRVVSTKPVGIHIMGDRTGRVFAYGGDDGIYELANGRAQRITLPDDAPDADVSSIVPDTGKGIWIGTRAHGLWHVVGDHAELISTIDSKPGARLLALAQTSDGTMWANGEGVGGGLRRLVDGRWLRPPGIDTGGIVISRAAAEAPDGTMWFATNSRGLLRWSHGQMTVFGKADGLSDNALSDVHVDADGSLWAATAGGALDQIRPAPFVTLNRRNGFPIEMALRFVEDESGSVWASPPNAKLPVELIDAPFAGRREDIHVKPAALSPSAVGDELLTSARGGGVWLGPREGGLIRYRNGRVERWTERDGMPPTRFYAATEAPDGALWLSEVGRGFGEFHNGRFRAVALPGIGTSGVSGSVLDDRGHVWVAAIDAVYLYEFFHDSLVNTLGRREGIAAPIGNLALEHGDTLWGVNDSGVVRVANGHGAQVRNVAMRAATGTRPALTVAAGYLWVINPSRTVRLSLSDLKAAADGKPVTPVAQTFGSADGLLAPQAVALGLFPIFRAHDGRVWMATADGIAITDPAHEISDRHAPPAHVEEIDVGNRVFRGHTISIPPNPDRVSIHYTVNNLFSPEKTKIEVRLDGVDAAWTAGAAARVTSYTQLRPGNYHFRVRGWNGDGIASPNEAGLDFTVLPAWYQTLLFRAFVILFAGGSIAMITLLLQLRRHAAAQIALKGQYEAALGERTRIAQDLHDTLLQGFIGVTLQLKAAQRALPERPEAAAQTLDAVQRLARNSLREARERVWDMRDPTLETTDVAGALESLAKERASGTDIAVSLSVNGERRRLPRPVEDAAFRIGREAIANAVRHASPRHIEIEVTFSDATFELSIRDDGRGFTTEEADDARRHGHFGLTGVRERAIQMGGQCEIRPREGGGTIFSLTLPV